MFRLALTFSYISIFLCGTAEYVLALNPDNDAGLVLTHIHDCADVPSSFLDEYLISCST